MRVQKSLLIALCLTLAGAACSKNNGNPGEDGGTNAYALAVVGPAVLTMHPNDVKTLSVALAQANVGPVANADIHFEFDNEDPAGAQIDIADATTTAAGNASFKLTAGATATFKVIASWNGHPEVSPVAFSIQVVTVRKLLQIVGSPQVRVANDGQSATVTMAISSSLALKAQLLDQDTGNPIAGDSISFSIPAVHSVLSGGSSATTAAQTTGATGTAQVFLVSGAVIESFLVTAQDQAGGVGAVTYSVTVQNNAAGSTCTTSAQCDPGQSCVDGVCSTNGSGASCTVGNDNGCPFGYVCVDGTCQPPANPNCDPNNPAATCPAGDTCVCTGSPSAQVCQCEPICGTCPPGETCVVTGNTGTCEPAAGTTPDLTGVWYTRHSFSIQQALPTAVQDIQQAVRDIDQLIQGQFFSGFWSWLNPIVEGIISTYVPSWVTTIIEVLDDVSTIFSNLRSVGSMRITAGADATQFKGTEVWTSLVFYWLPLCNGQIGGNSFTPDCARLDVATTDATDPTGNGTCAGADLPTVSVQVAPFTGQVAQTAGVWNFNVLERKVQLDMGKVILVAINLLISYLTPYDCLADALDCSAGNPCLIDCPSFGTFIDNLTNGLLDASTAEGICDVAATAAGQLVSGLLGSIQFSVNTLDFAGHAVVTADGSASGDCSGGSGGPCANQLGNDNYDTDLQNKTGNQDGWWSGSFFFNVIGCTAGSNGSSCMPGAWEAERTPVQ